MAAWRHEISLRVLKIFFQHSKRNFVSPRGHVISSISSVLSKHFLLFSLNRFLMLVLSKNGPFRTVKMVVGFKDLCNFSTLLSSFSFV